MNVFRASRGLLPYRLERVQNREASELAARHEDGDGLADLLSLGEKTALSAMRMPKRRRDWLAGRLALKRLVAAMLRESGRDVALSEVEVLNRKDGSPYVALGGAAQDRLPVSLSHGPKGAVAAAVPAGGLIGVDLEAVAERPASFADIFIHPGERAPELDQPAEIIRLWTLKEAVLKLLGLGLSVDLWDVRFPAFQGAPTLRLELHGKALARWESLGRPAVRFDSRIDGDEALSVAYSGDPDA